MKAMQISQYGKDEKVILTEVKTPAVGAHDILIEVYAASVNPVDYKLRDGALKAVRPKKLPLTLGNDFAGIVTKIGAEVTRFKEGDAVYGAASADRWGSFAEYFVVGEQYAALKPSNLSFTEAASLPLTALTAYQALTEWLDVQPSQKIFIPGGAGGVGVVAIPIAKHLGAYVATTGSPRGRELINSLHPDLFIDYQTTDFSKQLTNYDGVFDTRGGDDLIKAFSILKPKGKIVSIAGIPDKAFAKREELPQAIQLALAVNARKVHSLAKKHEVSYHYFMKRADGIQLEKITHLIEKGVIKPIIDKIFTFEETQAALDYVEAGKAKGKVVITVKGHLSGS
ncbi:NADP-dependent oxidoreductase [Brochothrix thermosphacta]|uniref:Enoyl reductase (ER) domain-containing protein n=1 Tax=Brochothrix thermosphacta TaxID=2756 RepID=A0A2X0RZJ6_BROTH|nr:NADP-dependent oxidoreductase [Brochothrix thermosphacta]ODJ51608.1 hypothetical protein BFR40_06285 [Brochothrix thermosphacta]ODJ62795.1 hypothetical protein BFR37_03300 [Brochothrix thermosphacta]WKK68510.1 NADP-dependent oxidoreductase [Brochothrix thermosphacta]SOC19482.1 Zn-dependent oxidoreductase, NADPH:quinone reductase [Brochothrix thermosphacta]SPP27537.1 conserved hypothetical protein [Brochothrix thermosphacta]